MLDCIDLEVAPQPDDRLPRSDTIIQKCRVMWESFNRDAIVTAITYALMVVWSHYQSVDLQAIGAGFAEGMGEAETQQLEDEVEDVVIKLASDIDLFGKTDGDGEGQ